jgi:hypothetical protein
MFTGGYTVASVPSHGVVMLRVVGTPVTSAKSSWCSILLHLLVHGGM